MTAERTSIPRPQSLLSPAVESEPAPALALITERSSGPTEGVPRPPAMGSLDSESFTAECKPETKLFRLPGEVKRFDRG